MLFLHLVLFTVCYAHRHFLSSTDFLILLIWPWMYFSVSFLNALVSYLLAFLISFTDVYFVVFFLSIGTF